MSKNKTRTKDKYRVVYNETQRIELENEFKMNEYIAIPRKQEIAHKLQLSERQIKIWFQNRRAKKRKQQKRRLVTTSNHTNSTTTTTLIIDHHPTVSVTQSAQIQQAVGITSVSIGGNRKSSAATTTSLGPSKGLGVISPSSSHHHHHHHPMQDTYQEPAMIAAAHHHEQRDHHHHQQHQQHQHHQHQLQQQHQHHHQLQQLQQQQIYQHHHGRLVQSNNNNYYESNYQDQCHQDYYNMINHAGHRANLDQFHHQPSPATPAVESSVGGAGSHQNANQNATQSWPNLSQSTSPQIATSPAIMNNNHQIHLGTTHQTPPNLPSASVSPYHANHTNSNATYTNGYPPLPAPAPAPALAPAPSTTQLPPHQSIQHQQPQQYYIPHQHHSHQNAMMQSQMHSEDIYAA